MITLPLKDFASRVGASLCYAVECPEMVVKSSQEYLNLAVRFATPDQGNG